MKNEINISYLTAKLQAEDKKYGTLNKRLFGIYLVLVGLEIILVVRDIISGAPTSDILSSVGFLVAMSIFVLIFFKCSREFNNIDYSQPILVVLKNGAKRYKLFTMDGLWVLLAVIIIGGSLCLEESFLLDILLVQVIYWLFIALAVLAGVIVWKIRYKPLRDNLLQMIRELTDDNIAV